MKGAVTKGLAGGGLLLLALAALFPELAWAAEAEEVGHKVFSLKEELFKFMNTLIVVVLVYKMAAEPLRKFFRERREGIRKALAEAEAARVEAEKMLEEQRSKVADLEAELSRVRSENEKERTSLRERLLADQENQANRLLEQTRNAIELEEKKARQDLQNRAAAIALELAEDILKRNLGEEDQKRLAASFLDKMEKPNGGSR